MGLYGDYLLVFGIAALVTYVLIFPIKRVALRYGAVAQPGEHHMHTTPTPTIGGAAMFGALIVSLLVASRFHEFSQIFQSSEPVGLLIGALVIYLVGLVDDVKNISPPAKIAGQVLAAMILVLLGVTMYYFKIPFVPGLIVLPATSLPLVTALWVIGMANAVNLIDGLDGLAAGIVAIAAGALCIYGLRLEVLGNLTPDNMGPLVAAIACGVCVGFLPHNFHPARVFMGDGGALFLGLLMAASTMVIGGRIGTAAGTSATDVSGLTYFRFAPLFIPFFILGVPIVDTAFAIIRRTVRRSGVSERDLGHLHHRLVRLGHGHRRAVLILWAWTGLLSLFVLLPLFNSKVNVFIPFILVALAVGLYTVFRPGSKKSLVEEEEPTVAELVDAIPEKEHATAGAGSTISVVMSGGAGVATAGEPDLASPLLSNKSGRRKRPLIPRRGRGAHSARSGAGPSVEVAPPTDEMRG